MYPAVDYYPRTMQEGQSLHVKHRIYCGEFLSVHIDVNSSCFRSNRYQRLRSIPVRTEAAFYYAIMKFFWNKLFDDRRNLLIHDNGESLRRFQCNQGTQRCFVSGRPSEPESRSREGTGPSAFERLVRGGSFNFLIPK